MTLTRLIAAAARVVHSSPLCATDAAQQTEALQGARERAVVYAGRALRAANGAAALGAALGVLHRRRLRPLSLVQFGAQVAAKH